MTAVAPYKFVLFDTRERFTVTDIAFHRNGIMGESFFVCSFTDGTQEFVGFVFDEPGQCGVIVPADLSSKWRGDLFEPYLRAAILARYEEIWAA